MTQSNDIQDTIAAKIDTFMGAFNRGDASGLAALYTEDGQVLPPNSDFVTGQQAIQAFWQALMDMGIKEAMLEIVEVESHGERVIEISTYKLLGEGETVFDEGKYIIIWKQDQGRWKMHRDIFNSSMPVSGA
jgi:uncharacterized protein (TIGR02246 family)